ncbi:hypothetical protein DXT74_08920 [Chromobacterium sp. Rain0013]|nr:hypothetical protein DXT74_08920 [Chromobacterium sp. Rain0013]
MQWGELLSDKLLSAIITGFISLLIWGVQRWLEPGAKLGWWIPHDFMFSIPMQQPPNPLLIKTSTLTVQNLGSKTADDVQIMHETKVDHFQLHPRRDYSEAVAEDGTHTINVGSLGPKEWLQIQLLSHSTMPVLAGIRSKDGPAMNVRFQVVRHYSLPVRALLVFFLFVGGIGTLYWIVRATLYISHASGMF